MENWVCIGAILVCLTVFLTLLGKVLNGDFNSQEKLERELARCTDAILERINRLRQNFSFVDSTTRGLQQEKEDIFHRCDSYHNREKIASSSPFSSSDGDQSNFISLLHCAAFLGAEDCLRSFGKMMGNGPAGGTTLLSNQFNVLDNTTGMSPLHLASLSGEKGCVTKLFNLGSTLEVTDNLGRTPQMVAEAAGNVHCVTRYQQLSGQSFFSNLLLTCVAAMTAILLAQELRRWVRKRQHLAKKLHFISPAQSKSRCGQGAETDIPAECLICFCDLDTDAEDKTSSFDDRTNSIPLSLQGVFGFKKSDRAAPVICKKCQKGFHGACLAQWVLRRPTCPNCREIFFEEWGPQEQAGEAPEH